MATLSKEELLRIPEVVDEIKRHLWCESEKAGYDVGYEWAAEDWVCKYAKQWLSYHRPKDVMAGSKASKTRPSAKNSEVKKKRRAKSYIL